MKKIAKIILFIMCLIAMFSFVACNDNDANNNESDETDKTVYKIECEPSDYYVYNGTVSATSGNEAEVELISNYPAYKITGCTFNGNACERKSTEDANKQEFTFNMPSSDVKIKVLNIWNDLSTSGYNNFLSFNENNDFSTTSAFGDTSYNNDEYWGEPLVIGFTTNAGLMTSANITCFSTNEDIIPSTAIATKNTLDSNINKIIGGRIIINRSMIHTGSTQIVLRVASNNNNSYDAIIVATINVE